MTEQHASNHSDSVLGIVLGTVVPTVLSMLFGAVYMMAAGQGAIGEKVVAGMVCGLAAVLVPAFGLAWHACSVRHAPTRAETAHLWGLIPAALIAGSLGPALGGVAGYQFHALSHGITIGLFGLIAGPLAWQTSYWSDTLLAGHAPPHAESDRPQGDGHSA